MTRHIGGVRRSHVALGFLGLALVLLIAFAIVGCGSEAQESTSSITTPTTSAVESTLPSAGVGPNAVGTGAQVVVKNGKLDQPNLVVQVGTAVTFVNRDDDTTKTYELVAADGTFDTGVLAESDSYSVTFQKAGTVTYADKTDPSVKGTITVQ